jgi:hypothetical protein
MMILKRLKRLIQCLVMGAIFWPGLLWASGEKVDTIVIVADTRYLSGILAWWGNLYNESHVYFMLLTVVLIPIIGVVFGLVADVVMGRMGIDLESRELAEH